MTMELVRTAPERRRCALYRHFDEEDVLLYVGITEALGDRTNAGHARSSDWVQFAVRAEAEWYDAREVASVEERDAVRSEKPVFNRQYAEWDVDGRIADYLHAREVRALKAALETYSRAVGQFLEAAPAEDVNAATARAEHEYRCAEVAIDEAFPANVLRHLARIVRDRSADIADSAESDAYGAVAEFLHQRLGAIAERRKPPF